MGGAISPLQITCTGVAGLALTYSATGLPPGLVISSGGLISGTPTAAGSYPVTVTAAEGLGGTGFVERRNRNVFSAAPQQHISRIIAQN